MYACCSQLPTFCCGRSGRLAWRLLHPSPCCGSLLKSPVSQSSPLSRTCWWWRFQWLSCGLRLLPSWTSKRVLVILSSAGAFHLIASGTNFAHAIPGLVLLFPSWRFLRTLWSLARCCFGTKLTRFFNFPTMWLLGKTTSCSRRSVAHCPKLCYSWTRSLSQLLAFIVVQVVGALYVISVIGSWFNFLTLIFLGEYIHLKPLLRGCHPLLGILNLTVLWIVQLLPPPSLFPFFTTRMKILWMHIWGRVWLSWRRCTRRWRIRSWLCWTGSRRRLIKLEALGVAHTVGDSRSIVQVFSFQS